jgi:hypothetical protein
MAGMGERRGAYRALVGKPEGRRPLGRPRRRREDNIKMDLREVGWRGVDWIDLDQDRDRWRRALVYTVMNLLVPKNTGNFLSSLGHFSFSGRTLLHGVSYGQNVVLSTTPQFMYLQKLVYTDCSTHVTEKLPRLQSVARVLL